MPKCELARKGKVAVPEEELSSDDEGLMSPHGPSLAINTASLVMAARAHPGGPPVQTDTKRKMLSHGTAEWERVSDTNQFVVLPARSVLGVDCRLYN